jgi:hypothetical protein
MRKQFFLSACCLLLAACNNSYEEIEKIPKVENQYNPNLPTSVDRIMPTYGGIDGTFAIEGNFPGDTSNIKVYFGSKRAVVVATDGRYITGIVPKQQSGSNSVSVVIGQDSLAPDNLKFKYKQTKSVKTIAGIFGVDEYLDGDINAARMQEVSNIATVKGQKGDNIIAVQSWWGDKIRLISLDDNQVITLNTGMAFGTPGVDHTREKFYTIGHWGDQHTIYSFAREDGWTPNLTGVKIEQSDVSGNIWSCCFAEDDRHLYVLGDKAEFICVDLEEGTYETVALFGDVPTKFNDRSHLIYSPYHKCFFASFPIEAGIFKFYKDNHNDWISERYAGFNGSGSTTGHRLNDAQFIEPYGMAANEDGEIFVINRGGAFINKISGDIVEIVAGKPGAPGQTNGSGDPLDARFDLPQDIAIDADGNFYIAGGWDRTVRKLSIE